jgi:hypothetical protein
LSSPLAANNLTVFSNKILERVKEIVGGKDFKEVLKEEGN